MLCTADHNAQSDCDKRRRPPGKEMKGKRRGKLRRETITAEMIHSTNQEDDNKQEYQPFVDQCSLVPVNTCVEPIM